MNQHRYRLGRFPKFVFERFDSSKMTEPVDERNKAGCAAFLFVDKLLQHWVVTASFLSTDETLDTRQQICMPL